MGFGVDGSFLQPYEKLPLFFTLKSKFSSTFFLTENRPSKQTFSNERVFEKVYWKSSCEKV